MPSWIEERARIEALIYRDGPEVWRDLKASIRQAVADYTRIYTPNGKDIEFTDCQTIAPNCIRVRTLPQSGQADVSFEIRLLIDEKRIECVEAAKTFTLAVVDGKVVLTNGAGQEIPVESVCRAILEPLLAKLPRRPPNIML